MTARMTIIDGEDVPMRDGTVLKADIWLPAGEGPWPVLLMRTPYGKEDVFSTQYVTSMDVRAALRRGMAVVMQDTRGRGASEGTFQPLRHETEDGHDTIAWLCAQAFCDGRIAMFGTSYVGATQVMAMSGNPPGLCAVAPSVTTARHGETWLYRGGAVELGLILYWIILALGETDLHRRASGMEASDADRAAALLADFTANPDAAFARLPVRDDDLLRLAPYVADWFDAARANVATQDLARLGDLRDTDTPALVITGWNDLFVEGSIELFETLRGRWSEPGDVWDRLIVGPWSHANMSAWQGEGWHGPAGDAAFLADEQLAFFDAGFAGRRPDSPMVRYFRTGSDTWHAAPDWPLPGAVTKELFLAGSDELSDRPGSAGRHGYVSDPLAPVPTVGGASFLPGLFVGRNSGPKDQARVEAREDVLVFTSEPLEKPVEVTGLVTTTLWVESSAVTCDWTVRLCEVLGDGRSIGLVDGILRWTKTSAASGPAEVVVRLGTIGHLFGTGSRIRIQVASSNFPRFDRNPQSGISSVLAEKSDFFSASQLVLSGYDHPSRICLSMIPEEFPSLTGC